MPKILYVEDSIAARKILVRILKGAVEVIEASNIDAAEMLLSQNGHFNGIVIDYGLPKSNGIEFGKRLRNTQRYKDTPLILITSVVQDDLIHGARTAGFNQCINKMNAPETIKEQIIHQILNPEHKHFDTEHVLFNCITWEYENEYYQFSPDYNCTVHGKTPLQAEFQMKELLKSHCKETHKIWNPKIVKHSFDISDDSSNRRTK